MSKSTYASGQVSEGTSYLNASGPVLYPLTNDYLFRAVLQKNNYVLKGLICSLLHLSPDEVESVTVSNPIELGKTINKKDFFLDFTLFPDSPEFYSKYILMNVKNHTIYSDKFILSVVDLTQIELATEEDNTNQLDYWASLFKATTWEDIKMIAKNNSYFAEAAETMYQLSADEQIRLQCQARADFERQERSNKAKYAATAAENKALKEENATLKVELTTLKEEHTTLKEEHTALKEEHTALKKEHIILSEKYNTLESRYDTIQNEFSNIYAELKALKKS